MVTPAGGVQDGTALADVVDAVNGPVADFWEEQSRRRHQVGVTAQHDWITTTRRCSDPSRCGARRPTRWLRGGPRQAPDALRADAPSNLSGCSYGLAEVKGAPERRRAPLRAGRRAVGHRPRTRPQLRPRALVGPAVRAVRDSGGCATFPYGDWYDVMGVSWEQMGSLNVAQAGQLISVSASVQPGRPPTTVTIAPVSQRAGTRAIVLGPVIPPTTGWSTGRPKVGTPGWERPPTGSAWRRACSCAGTTAAGERPTRRSCWTRRPRLRPAGRPTAAWHCPSAPRWSSTIKCGVHRCVHRDRDGRCRRRAPRSRSCRPPGSTWPMRPPGATPVRWDRRPPARPADPGRVSRHSASAPIRTAASSRPSRSGPGSSTGSMPRGRRPGG